MRHSLLIAMLIVALASLGAGATARAAEFQAGVGRVRITPATPIRMAGYASRTSESLGVSQELWVKALALRDPEGRRVVIVTTDLIGLSGTVSGEVFRRAQERYGLKRPELLLTCSHTHSGPVVRDNLNVMAAFNEPETARVRAFTARLTDQLTDVIGAALDDLSPARLESGHGLASFAINRRQRSAAGVRIGVNPKGPVDHDVPVLKVTSPEGKLRAVLFGYACHNTTISGSSPEEFYQLNGDYAGQAAAALEARHPGATAMFTILCGADQNPNPRGSLALSRQHGQALAGEVDRVLGAEMHPVQPPIATEFQSIELAFAPHTRQTFEAELRKSQAPKGDIFLGRRAQLMLDAYDKGAPPRQLAYPIQAIRLGRDLTILALGGEVVVDYALRCKWEYAGENLMVIGYANEVMSYIPSQRVLREGGYEAETSMIYYGHPGPYADDVEERIFGGIHQVLGRLGVEPKKK